MHRSQSLPLLATLVSLAATSCQSASPPPATALAADSATRQAAIVNGTTEEGFPAVGALVLFNETIGYNGSFCSGTLVDPSWVLTAGHCLQGEGGFGNYVKPENVWFFIGSNATSPNPGFLPSGGKLVPSIAFYIHPQYKGTNGNDIALLRLAQPVTDVTPIPYYPGPFGSAFTGNIITYVGFGVTDGDEQDGGGIKRRAEMAIAFVEDGTYTSEFEDQGVCFGDSGGPGLRQFEGAWTVIGVNSAVYGSQNSVPCTDYAVHTRTDAFAEWLNQTISNPPEIKGCLLDKAFCICEEACLQDGSCDNSVCPVPGSCESLNICIASCEDSQACADDCFDSANDLAQERFGVMQGCLSTECAGLKWKLYAQCAYTTCGDSLIQCLEPNGGKGEQCPTVVTCLQACQGIPGCSSSCYQGATVRARVEAQTYIKCYSNQCPNLEPGTPAFQKCAAESCAAEIEACFDDDPIPPCNPLALDCPIGSACAATPDGSSACVPSGGHGGGVSCTPDETGATSACANGLVCAPSGESSYTCTPACGGDDDCPPGSACGPADAAFAGGVGVCSCIDADQDGACADDDCNEADAAIGPQVSEACGDGLDNDCDGTADEECDVGKDPGGALGEGGGRWRRSWGGGRRRRREQ